VKYVFGNVQVGSIKMGKGRYRKLPGIIRIRIATAGFVPEVPEG
jgi:hypothetical protein